MHSAYPAPATTCKRTASWLARRPSCLTAPRTSADPSPGSPPSGSTVMAADQPHHRPSHDGGSSRQDRRHDAEPGLHARISASPCARTTVWARSYRRRASSTWPAPAARSSGWIWKKRWSRSDDAGARPVASVLPTTVPADGAAGDRRLRRVSELRWSEPPTTAWA